jgi:hypothetical protein
MEPAMWLVHHWSKKYALVQESEDRVQFVCIQSVMFVWCNDMQVWRFNF